MGFSKAELLKRRRTKIVATLGPASADVDTVEQLIQAGVDVFRLNMSHGDHAGHAAAFAAVQEATGRLGVTVGVLADLCGPKIRVGRFAGGRFELVAGESVVVTTRDVLGGDGVIPSQYAGLARDVVVGCRVLIADGLFELRVDSIDGDDVHCTVVHGGTLTDRKGINLPDVIVSEPCLTDKDRVDARFALELGVDFLALSFVARASDIHELRSLMGDHPAAIVAKIERPDALQEIEAIIDAADAVMVARGDLGVELPPEEVPVVQRELIALSRAKSKPVIVATQMLESMIEHPQPTRAEVSDVSTAVFAAADAVMLSAETASGRYPVRAVELMDRIARMTEASIFATTGFSTSPDTPSDGFLEHHRLPLQESASRAVALLSRDLRARAVVAFSLGGTTARALSAARPAAPLVAITASATVARQMALLWGVVPYWSEGDPPPSIETLPDRVREVVKRLELAAAGQDVLLVSGFAGGSQIPAIHIIQV
jgi:pyruvate kinase